MVSTTTNGVTTSTEKTVKSFGNAPGMSTQMAYFGRLTYSYDNRYNVQG